MCATTLQKQHPTAEPSDRGTSPLRSCWRAKSPCPAQRHHPARRWSSPDAAPGPVGRERAVVGWQLLLKSDASRALQTKLEVHCSLNIFGIPDEHHWADQLTTVDEWITIEILVGIALEHWIGRKIELRDERLVPRRSDEIVDVLAHAVRIVSW